MKKRTMFLLLTMTLGLSLVGCGNKNTSDCEDGIDCCTDSTSDCCDPDGTCSACCVQAPEDVVFAELENKEALTTLTYKDVKFSLYSKSDEVQKAIDAFGKAKETDDYDAYTRYTFDKFNFEVNKEEGLAFTDIYVEDPDFKLANEISLGSSIEDVANVIGNDCSSECTDGSTTYINYVYEGGLALYFTFENDKLTAFSLNHCF